MFAEYISCGNEILQVIDRIKGGALYDGDGIEQFADIRYQGFRKNLTDQDKRKTL